MSALEYDIIRLRVKNLPRFVKKTIFLYFIYGHVFYFIYNNNVCVANLDYTETKHRL